MRLAVRLLRPAANQNVRQPKLWQDPSMGYYEQHGKTEFIPGEDYNLTDEQKKMVLWRYRQKEILKKEYLRREYDPANFKYKEGIIMDPAMFRWYAADMTQAEQFRLTPRSVFLYFGGLILVLALSTRLIFESTNKVHQAGLDDKLTPWTQNTVLPEITGPGMGRFTCGENTSPVTY